MCIWKAKIPVTATDSFSIWLHILISLSVATIFNNVVDNHVSKSSIIIANKDKRVLWWFKILEIVVSAELSLLLWACGGTLQCECIASLEQ